MIRFDWWARRNVMFFIVTTTVLSMLAWRRGAQMPPDGHTYAAWAEMLINADWNYRTFLQQATSVFSPTLYLGIVTVIAICKILAGAHWVALLVAFNILALSGLNVTLARLTWCLTQNRAATVFAVVLFVGCFEIAQWSYLVVSDPTFLWLVGLLLVLLCRLLLKVDGYDDRRAKARQVLAVGGSALLLLLATFYRPTGVLLWPCTLLAWWWWQRGRRSQTVSPRPAVAMGVMVLISIMSIWSHALLMENPSRWPLRMQGETIEFNARHYRMGEVIWDRRETWHHPPQRTLDFALISLARWKWFWAPLYPAFSRGHNILNALFFFPAYAFALVTFLSLLRDVSGDGVWNDGQRAALWILLVFGFVVSLFHALVQVDFDWRYRLPILPPLIVLAACGFAHAFSRLQMLTSNRLRPICVLRVHRRNR